MSSEHRTGDVCHLELNSTKERNVRNKTCVRETRGHLSSSYLGENMEIIASNKRGQKLLHEGFIYTVQHERPSVSVGSAFRETKNAKAR